MQEMVCCMILKPCSCMLPAGGVTVLWVIFSILATGGALFAVYHFVLRQRMQDEIRDIMSQVCGPKLCMTSDVQQTGLRPCIPMHHCIHLHNYAGLQCTLCAQHCLNLTRLALLLTLGCAVHAP
jgi:hypothetical protein